MDDGQQMIDHGQNIGRPLADSATDVAYGGCADAAVVHSHGASGETR